jgi:hypothetical protein
VSRVASADAQFNGAAIHIVSDPANLEQGRIDLQSKVKRILSRSCNSCEALGSTRNGDTKAILVDDVHLLVQFLAQLHLKVRHEPYRDEDVLKDGWHPINMSHADNGVQHLACGNGEKRRLLRGRALRRLSSPTSRKK